MTFDVSKFLALTALLAGAGIGSAACSSNDSDADAGGGSGGSGGLSSGGSNGNGGDGTAGNVDQGGDGGVGVGGAAGGAGAGEGGLGGAAGGAGGAGAAAGAGGEGGAPECLLTDPTFEGAPCDEILDTKCDGAEEGSQNPFYDACYATWGANTTVRAAFAECLEGDVCGQTAAVTVASCWSTLAELACPVEGVATTCTTAVGTCSTGLTTGTCTAMLNTTAELDAEYLLSCMDPLGEFYDDSFEGDCKARLATCSGVLAL